MKKVLNKKNFITAFLALAVIILGISYFMNNNLSDKPKQVCIGNKACFNYEIADTDEKKILGLGNRDFLWENDGMLFPFPEKSSPGFWMKGMRFPIDIIWIDSEMKVSGIVRDFQPCEPNEQCTAVYPDEKIIYVLEINAGLSERHGLEAGDAIYLK